MGLTLQDYFPIFHLWRSENPEPIDMRLPATSSRRGAMRMAYYPSDFIGHELQ